MHTAIRLYQVDPGSVNEITRRVNEGLVPIIKDASGFQAYYALDAGGGRLASVSVFEDRDGAEESTRIAADWIRQNMASLIPDPPEVLEGELFANEEASAGPVNGITDTVGGVTEPVSGVTDTLGGVTEPVSGVTDNLLGGGEKKRSSPGKSS